MTNLKNTYQEYWDACLIRAWRNFQTVGQLFQMLKSITKIETTDGLLRKPQPFVNPKMGVRVFSARFLPDINEWLHNHLADKDILLAKKLSVSQSRYPPKFNCFIHACRCNSMTIMAKIDTNNSTTVSRKSLQ